MMMMIMIKMVKTRMMVGGRKSVINMMLMAMALALLSETIFYVKLVHTRTDSEGDMFLPLHHQHLPENPPKSKKGLPVSLKTTAKRHEMEKRRLELQAHNKKVEVAAEMLSPESIAQVPVTAFRDCHSPEVVDWPLYGGHHNNSTLPSIVTPTRTCGIQEPPNSDTSSSSSSFRHYFRNVIINQQIRPILQQKQDQDEDKYKCRQKLVVFGVAFGDSFLQDMFDSMPENGGRVNSTALLEQHGYCFFTFTLQGSSITNTSTSAVSNLFNTTNQTYSPSAAGQSSSTSPFLLGHTWIVPIPQSVLPYTNNRRNAKLLKYMGHYAFLGDEDNNNNNNNNSSQFQPQIIVWQDAKFFRPFSIFDQSIPSDYSKLWKTPSTPATTTETVCVTTVGLPIHISTFSRLHHHVSRGRTSNFPGGYADHCKTIISALKDRPNVTDNPEALLHQCQAYLRHVQEHEHRIGRSNNSSSTSSNRHHPLDFGLIDSAFIIWNESTETCRAFNQQLRCTILDQLHCHSDRDQVLLPFVLYEAMNHSADQQNGRISSSLQTLYQPNNNPQKIPVDKRWNSRFHDLDFVSVPTFSSGSSSSSAAAAVATTAATTGDILVRVIRSACHWYHTFPVGTYDCFDTDWFPSPEEWNARLATMNKNITNGTRHGIVDSLTTRTAVTKSGQEPSCKTVQKCTNAAITSKEHDHGNSICPTQSVSVSFQNHMKHTQENIIQPLSEQCPDMVVFGVAFDKESVAQMNPANSTQSFFDSIVPGQAMAHGKCFFMFVLEDDLRHLRLLPSEGYTSGNAIVLGHWWLIPMPNELVPHRHTKRSATYFIKYSGSFLFPNTRTILWQDAAFFRPVMIWAQPVNYHSLVGAVPDTDPCVTTFGTPFTTGTIGRTGITPKENAFLEYCKTQILSLASSSSYSNSLSAQSPASSMIEQCNNYIQRVYRKEMSADFLSQGLVDTDFIIWNESTKTCRRFNDELRCKLINELGCHSGSSISSKSSWDTIAFPVVLYDLGLNTVMRKNSRKPVDDAYSRRMHDLYFVKKVVILETKEEHEQNLANHTRTKMGKVKRDMVKVVRSLCHWSNKRLGTSCPAFRRNAEEGGGRSDTGAARLLEIKATHQKRLAQQQQSNTDNATKTK